LKNDGCSLYGDISALLKEANEADTESRLKKQNFIEYLINYSMEENRIFKKIWLSI
jgi:hypothetical protein